MELTLTKLFLWCRNWAEAIGTGERCLPGDPDDCGDGGKATDARLSYPKGMFIIHQFFIKL